MNRRLALLFLVILAIKAIFLVIDSEPSFEFGDSTIYLATAIGKWIPPSHGFVYGLLMRPLTVWPRTLEPCVLVQVLLSAVSSWLIAVCLVRYFGARFSVAALCSIACAIEPLQLMRERFFLPESLATFAFAVLVLAVFSYLKTNALSTLAIIQIIGAIAVSIRLQSLPTVILLSVLLPFVSRRALSFWKTTRRSGMNWFAGLRFVLLPLFFSVLLSQTLLFAYRHLYGELLDRPPAYTYRDGVSLAADFAPLIQPIDYPDPSKRDAIFRELKFPLSDLKNRRAQRWMEGGLCDVIHRNAGKNQDETNRLARKTAVHAIRRDPWGVVRLGLLTYAEFFDYGALRWSLQLEQGRFVKAPPRDAQMLQDVFGVDVDKRGFNSVTKRWEEHSAVWCWFLVLLPVCFPVYVAVQWRRLRVPHTLCALFGIIFLIQAVVPVQYASPRYLVPLPWLAFLMIGCVVTSVVGRIPLRQREKASAIRT